MRRFLLCLMACLLLSGCSGIETAPDNPATFVATGYTDYAWRNDPLPEPVSYRDTQPYALDVALRAAIEERLGELGYRRVARDEAEFLVDYFAATGVVGGRLSRSVSPGARAANATTINRQINQAEVDNAHALSGPRQTGNIALVFADRRELRRLWAVRISTLVENANRVNPDRVRRAMRKALSTLPEAVQPS